MSFFQKLATLPPDSIFGLSKEYKKDPRNNKYTLITGYFRDKNLITPVLETVTEVEKKLVEEGLSREYLPIDGDQEFVSSLGRLVFAEGWSEDTICGFQTVGATGALYQIGRFARFWTDTIGISNPTWANHWSIFSLAGLKTISYPYYENRKLVFEKCVRGIEALPERACVLLHTNCHNSTGADFSKEEWKQLSQVIKKKKLFPILDMAYQGFSGEPAEDAFAPRLFLDEGNEFALTYTCSKNFSLYSERVGALFVVTKENRQAVQSQIKAEIRGSYSNPPIHGAYVVKTILQTPELKKKWIKELQGMRTRMQAIRKEFVELMGEGWEEVADGHGLFCYSEISEDAIKKLREEKGFYVAGDGRINLTGLNEKNIDAFVSALKEVG